MKSTELALLLNNDVDKITRIGEIIGKKIAIRDNFENLNEFENIVSNLPKEPAPASLLIEKHEIENLLVKYFDPESERYVFKKDEFECRKRNTRTYNVSFEQSVAGKKLSYLHYFYDKDGKFDLDLDYKNAKLSLFTTQL